VPSVWLEAAPRLRARDATRRKVGQAADSCECQECEECGYHTWLQEAPSGQVLCSECFDSEMLEWWDRS